MTFNTRIEEITINHLQRLVDSKAFETRNLEFKRDLYGKSDSEKKEFLADVTSLANASGGDLLIGVSDVDGQASALPGVKVESVDAEFLRLENIVRDSVEPRLPVFQTIGIEIGEGKIVLLLRVPASVSMPHRVKFQGWGKFFTRNSRGKYEMDTHELRTAFIASEGLADRFRALHQSSVARAKGVNMPFSTGQLPVAVASIAPLSLFREQKDFEITQDMAQQPYNGRGTDWLHTLEGILFHSPPNKENVVSTYALSHRNGWVDSAWCIQSRQNPSLTKTLHPMHFELGLRDQAATAINRLAPFGVTGPWIIMVSLLNILSYELHYNLESQPAPSFRSEATLPELQLDSINDLSLRPITEAFWRVFGYKRPQDLTF